MKGRTAARNGVRQRCVQRARNTRPSCGVQPAGSVAAEAQQEQAGPHLGIVALIPADFQAVVVSQQGLGDLQGRVRKEASARVRPARGRKPKSDEYGGKVVPGRGCCLRRLACASHLRRKDKAQRSAHHAAHHKAGPEAAAAVSPAASRGGRGGMMGGAAKRRQGCKLSRLLAGLHPCSCAPLA